MYSTRRIFGASVVVAICCGSCGGSDSPSAPPPPPPPPPAGQWSLSIAAGSSLADTIQAPEGAITVSLRDGVRLPVAGALVRFSVERTADSTLSTTDVVGVGAPAGGSRSDTASATTDSSGSARIAVRYGSVADSVLVVARVGNAQIQAVAHVIVRPGVATRVFVNGIAWSSFVTLGQSKQFNFVSEDRLTNRRTDAITISAGAGATVDPDGTMHAGPTPTLSYVVGVLGSLRDSIAVSLLPDLPVVALRYGYIVQSALVQTALDGTSVQLLVPLGIQESYVHPALTVDGARLYYGISRISVREPDGTLHAFATAAPISQGYAAPSSDGQWVYFLAGGFAGADTSIYRAHPDGTGLALFTSISAGATTFAGLSATPDGGSLLVTYQSSAGTYNIGRLDIATKQLHALGITGFDPVMSPDGRMIAFRAPPVGTGGVGIFDVATGATTTYLQGTGHQIQPFAQPWTRDSRWLLITDVGTVLLVNASTGSAIPVPALGHYLDIIADPENATVTPPANPAMMDIVAGGGFVDTISTPVPIPLSVRLHLADGTPLAGVPVQFVTGRSLKGLPLLALGRAGTAAKLNLIPVVDTTDANGDVGASVALGLVAGTEWTAVNAPSLGLTDTVTYTARTGQPYWVMFAVADSGKPDRYINGTQRDTAVLASASILLRAHVYDRGTNLTSGTPQFAAEGAIASVTQAGAAVAGASPGIGRVLASYGSLRDTMTFSVLPSARVVASGYTSTRSIMLVNLDATGGRSIATLRQRVSSPRWAPDGAHVVYADSDAAGHAHLYVVDTIGSAPQQLDTGSVFNGIAGVYYSADGANVLVNAAASGRTFTLWSVASTGGGVRNLEDTVLLARSFTPTPSPDGTKVLLVTADGRMATFDWATGGVTTLASGVGTAVYAPDGSIVYVRSDSYTRSIQRMNGDGSGTTTISQVVDEQLVTTNSSYSFAVTRDGGWVVIGVFNEYDGTALVHLFSLADGTELQTRLTFPMYLAMDIHP